LKSFVFLSLQGVLIFSLSNFTPAYYDKYTFPEWVDGLGWLIGIVSILPLPTFALYRLFRAKEVSRHN
jgi:solute carrier family 6 amino acid transporter-like protein 5/7/9/14